MDCNSFCPPLSSARECTGGELVSMGKEITEPEAATYPAPETIDPRQD